MCEEKKSEFTARLQFHWWIGAASFIKRLFRAIGFHNKKLTSDSAWPKKPEHEIRGSSICSKFVADCYIEAARRIAPAENPLYFRDAYMNISPFTLLKSLQSYLHNNINYYCYILPTKKNSYNALMGIVSTQIQRLIQVKGLKNQKSQHKAEKIKIALSEHENKIQEDAIVDSYYQSLDLMKAIAPILRENTGMGLAKPTSYKKTIARAKSQGIYPEFFSEHYFVETPEMLDRYLKDLKYNSNQCLIYKEYRSRGFSDSEAQFEASPTLKKWCVNHPRPVKTAIATGIGFFGVLAYAQAKTQLVQHRNNEYLAANLRSNSQ
jgi:hypothetical protein